jgi:hypothetical protein
LAIGDCGFLIAECNNGKEWIGDWALLLNGHWCAGGPAELMPCTVIYGLIGEPIGSLMKRRYVT